MKLGGDIARDTLKENNQSMSQTGWRDGEVSKQLILAHYISIATLRLGIRAFFYREAETVDPRSGPPVS